MNAWKKELYKARSRFVRTADRCVIRGNRLDAQWGGNGLDVQWLEDHRLFLIQRWDLSTELAERTACHVAANPEELRRVLLLASVGIAS